jgi:hypothetical protein
VRKKNQPGCPCCGDGCGDPINLCVTVTTLAPLGCLNNTPVPLPGAGIEVRRALTNEVVASATTGESGRHCFTITEAGAYTVRASVPFSDCQGRTECVSEAGVELECGDSRDVALGLCCASATIEVRDWDTGAPIDPDSGMCGTKIGTGTYCITGATGGGGLDCMAPPCTNVHKEGYWSSCCVYDTPCLEQGTANTVWMYSKANWVRVCNGGFACPGIPNVGCGSEARRTDMLPKVLKVRFNGPAQIFGSYAGTVITLTLDESDGEKGAEPCFNWWQGTYQGNCNFTYTSGCLGSTGVPMYCLYEGIPFGIDPRACGQAEWPAAIATLTYSNGGNCASGGVSRATLTWQLYPKADCNTGMPNLPYDACGYPVPPDPLGSGGGRVFASSGFWCPTTCDQCQCWLYNCACTGNPLAVGCTDPFRFGTRPWPTQVSTGVGCTIPGCAPFSAIKGPVDLAGTIWTPQAHQCCESPPNATYEIFE